MKKTKKTLCLLLAATTICSMGVGCNNDELFSSEPAPDASKEHHLYVGVYDGALGWDWALEIEKMYEAENPDVDVIIRHKKNDYDDAMLLSRIQYNDEDIYFASDNSLTALQANGSIADITDVVQEKVYDAKGELVKNGAGTKSIEDSFWDEWQEACKIDGKYYAVHNWAPPQGLSYDADLFEEKGYQVPETYDQLKSLMNRMVADGITPLTFSSVHYYIVSSAQAFYANYEGKNNFMLNSTFKGTDTNLGEITHENAYLLAKQEGRKVYYQFLHDIANNTNYVTTATRGNQTHLDAQNEFVNSIGTSKRVGMILENSFWEREAKGTLESLGAIESSWGWGERNFKYMIAPVNKTLERKTVLLGSGESYTFINAHSDELEIAKDFLQFTQSRTALATYTIHTGTLRPYDYDLTEAEYQQCTPYTQSLVDLMRRDDVDFVAVLQNNPIAKQMGHFRSAWMDLSKTSIVETSSPFSAFSAYPNLTVDAYFNGSYTAQERDYSKYYNKVYGN